MKLLSDQEVIKLTGYRRPSTQAKWLKANKIRHWINGAGRVIVPCSALDAVGVEKQGIFPNFEAITA